jgi:hypothetical protein
MVSGDDLAVEVKRAVELAREAMEQDALTARSRGWGSPSPDAASVGMLAAGILVANAIRNEREAATEVSPAPRIRRARSRSTA